MAEHAHFMYFSPGSVFASFVKSVNWASINPKLASLKLVPQGYLTKDAAKELLKLAISHGKSTLKKDDIKTYLQSHIHDMASVKARAQNRKWFLVHQALMNERVQNAMLEEEKLIHQVHKLDHKEDEVEIIRLSPRKMSPLKNAEVIALSPGRTLSVPPVRIPSPGRLSSVAASTVVIPKSPIKLSPAKNAAQVAASLSPSKSAASFSPKGTPRTLITTPVPSPSKPLVVPAAKSSPSRPIVVPSPSKPLVVPAAKSSPSRPLVVPSPSKPLVVPSSRTSPSKPLVVPSSRPSPSKPLVVPSSRTSPSKPLIIKSPTSTIVTIPSMAPRPTVPTLNQ